MNRSRMEDLSWRFQRGQELWRRLRCARQKIRMHAEIEFELEEGESEPKRFFFIACVASCGMYGRQADRQGYGMLRLFGRSINLAKRASQC